MAVELPHCQYTIHDMKLICFMGNLRGGVGCEAAVPGLLKLPDFRAGSDNGLYFSSLMGVLLVEVYAVLI